jgi:hypothetical protein
MRYGVHVVVAKKVNLSPSPVLARVRVLALEARTRWLGFWRR